MDTDRLAMGKRIVADPREDLQKFQLFDVWKCETWICLSHLEETKNHP